MPPSPNGAPLAVKTTTPQPAPRVVDSNTLLQGASSVHIRHDGQNYLLRVTRENKLILTK